ncbi:MAG TPA: acyl-CoA dehydrogenase family protein [Amycolatopsis sp.]|uniref:acyl-CoA dehydrogenase family protein n=1 Tax=Amycolatopsis sp. TaxID=37632 RepID=UPI002B488B57|nr:acyl-CoA dehydrogenase family protein [Amycolatopsis sp.]HKS47012.1 acyl-CoA dehydrogenase family protein [Amycolatopsis sp.]
MGHSVILGFSDEHEELRQVLRRFFAEKSPESEVRRLMGTEEGYDPTVWKQMVSQLDLPGLGIGEDYGGSGSGQHALTVVFEEMGRALVCAPYFSTVALAATLLAVSGDEAARRDCLPGIASGETIATVALTEDSGRWDEAGVRMPAVKDGGSWRLTGEKTYVVDGSVSDLVLVVARTPAGVSLFAVEKSAGTYTAEALSTLDQTRKLARLVFESTPARLIGVEGEGWAAVSRMLDRAAVSLAAEQVGGARRVLETAFEYARSRVQFGQVIGRFQAIKHRCADLFVELEAATAALRYATWAVSDDAADLRMAASLAKVRCSEAYVRVAAESIQIHGAIGFTWEHPAHLYFKRAKASQLFLGTPACHRAVLVRQTGI